jgi:5-methylcytosine-specific restriction endonuclease McrA
VEQKEKLRTIGQSLYKQIKARIKREAKTPDEWFYLNRFIYSRLQLDERRLKEKIKDELFKATPTCAFCGQKFDSEKGVEIHRKDGEKGYSRENCVLVHRECHEKLHSKRVSST